MRNDFKHTLYACCGGHIAQAIVNNFIPLLFLTLQSTYGISLERIALLVSINFFMQLSVDFLAAQFIARIGYRRAAVWAHLFCAAGLAGLSFLPDRLPDPYAGILLCVALYAMGGGLIEVVISPMVEAAPLPNKASTMSFLHAFYCWGCVLVILGSTLFFMAFGVARWRVLACIWALLPLVNAFYFTRVPIRTLEEEAPAMDGASLFRSGAFYVLVLVMLCGGAAEQSMSQWASAFTEAGLGVSKTLGDLAGPCAFALLMGISRTLHAKYGERFPLTGVMAASGCLCVCSYLMAALSKNPVLALAGCALCGLSVGAFWPGTLSLASTTLRRGGTRMFALLALAGDMGCTLGPAMVGLVSAAQGNELRAGLLSAAIFPALLVLGLLLCRRTLRNKG